MEVRRETWTYFSYLHLDSAFTFAELCKEVEESKQNGLSTEEQQKQRSFAIGSVISSFSYLEAFINEFFDICLDETHTDYKTLDTTWLNQVTAVAKVVLKKRSFGVLEKFEIALEATGKSPVLDDDDMYENARVLNQLRNRLVHHKPEWIGSSPDDFSLGDRLKDKFKLNPHAGRHDPFFPDQCLCFGCALWAVETAFLYAENFSALTGYVPSHKFLSRDIDRLKSA